MESEDLQISTQRATVRYIFRNTTAKDIEATVAKRVAPTRYELMQYDFRPSRELKLLILQSPNQNAN